MQGAHQQETRSEDLADLFDKVRSYTETLCEPLKTEDFIPQPIVDVSPPKWNIAHTTWFFEEMILKKFVPNYQEHNPAFGFLFNSYYNTIGERTARDQRGSITRPTVEEVFAYRRAIDERMNEFLQGAIPAEAIDMVILGLNHEQQHQELLLTDLKYTFSQNPLFPTYKEDFARVGMMESWPAEFVEMDEGIYGIGHSGEGFCFDNELARHKVYLQEYSICNRLVTNGAFVDFIEDGGYTRHELWHAEGWDWVNTNTIRSPLYWHDRDGERMHYTLGGLRPLPLGAPVCHVSFYEAFAFAEWKGMRLPTEFEWEAASDKFDWGLRWEWTNSAYLPYPGFLKPIGAVGEYNGKFMINQMVLRGASAATPPGHSRQTYRNFFHPHLRWQFSGLRLVK
ncbi:MAG: ergothioneine biosynthesis protein EgtB [Blastocatellia bacterium]|nr:ergothioneine biosynthesis protein EgtB [Blastocatellia bacterium]